MPRQTATVSILPPQQAFYHAVLKYLAAQSVDARREEIQESVLDILGLTEAQRNERLANLTQLRHRHRSGFALSMLKKAGYVESPSRGLWRITDRGRQRLAQHPTGFSPDAARELLRECREAMDQNDEPHESSADMTILQTPNERIDSAIEEIQNSISDELLERIAGASPTFFEELVLDLLHSMGYGAREDDLQHIGGSGDGGFDGVISLDRLGLEKVYVQAKRWQGSVGRPEIQTFYGALSGRRARKGVFITTSTFTREARDFGNQISECVVLIDGERLTDLMIEFGVGVTHYRQVRLPRVDGDYFDAE